MVLAAMSIYLQQKGLIGQEEMQLIATIAGGFTIVKTVDRNIGDKKAEPSPVTVNTTGEVSSDTIEKIINNN